MKNSQIRRQAHKRVKSYRAMPRIAVVVVFLCMLLSDAWCAAPAQTAKKANTQQKEMFTCHDYGDLILEYADDKYQRIWMAYCIQYAMKQQGDDLYYWLQYVQTDLWHDFVDEYSTWFCGDAKITEEDRAVLALCVTDSVRVQHLMTQMDALNNIDENKYADLVGKYFEWGKKRTEDKATMKDMPRADCSEEYRKNAEEYFAYFLAEEEVNQIASYGIFSKSEARQMLQELFVTICKTVIPADDDMALIASIAKSRQHIDNVLEDLIAGQSLELILNVLFDNYKKRTPFDPAFRDEEHWATLQDAYNELQAYTVTPASRAEDETGKKVFRNQEMKLSYPSELYGTPAEIMRYEGMFMVMCTPKSFQEASMLIITGTQMDVSNMTIEEQNDFLNTLLTEQMNKMIKQETLSEIQAYDIKHDAAIPFPNRYRFLNGKKYGVPIKYFMSVELQNSYMIVKMLIYNGNQDYNVGKKVLDSVRIISSQASVSANTGNSGVGHVAGGSQAPARNGSRTRITNVYGREIKFLQRGIYKIGDSALQQSETDDECIASSPEPQSPLTNDLKKKYKCSYYSFYYTENEKVICVDEAKSICADTTTGAAIQFSYEIAPSGMTPEQVVIQTIKERSARYSDFYIEPVSSGKKKKSTFYYTHYIADDSKTGNRMFGAVYVMPIGKFGSRIVLNVVMLSQSLEGLDLMKHIFYKSEVKTKK